MKPQSHPPINVEVKIDSEHAIRVVPGTDKEQKFTVKVEITPSISQEVVNPLWCIVWRGDPLTAIDAYQNSGEEEFYFSSYPPPVYVTHWQQEGVSMTQLKVKLD